MFTSLLRCLNWGSRRHGEGRARRKPHRNPPAQRRSFVPRLDMLEDRTLPSTFTVLNLLDSGAGSLRSAIEAANTNPGADDIRFAGGLSGTITLTTGQLSITDPLTVSGPGAHRLAVSGNDASRVFRVAGAHLTITHGRADNGGGIRNEAGATLNLTHVVLANNQATALFGGGLDNLGSATITASMFTGNRSDGEGGAIITGRLDRDNTTLTVTNSTLANNQATGPFGGFGGALLNDATATFTNTTFIGNAVLSDFGAGGGAIFNNGDLTLTNCRLDGNQAIGGDGTGGFALGGAIWNEGAATLTITNSTIMNNLAKGGDPDDNPGGPFFSLGNALGGGIYSGSGATLIVTNSAFIGNRAVGGNSAAGVGGEASGGGILDLGGETLTVTNCTFLGNQARGGAGGPGAAGGRGLGGAIQNALGSTATLTNVAVLGNRAVGGTGGAGARGGDGIGGAIANGVPGFEFDFSSLTLNNSFLAANVAQGGAGGTGGDGGNGWGGGLFAGTDTTATLRHSAVTANRANGGAAGAGGSAGQGRGGGVYVEPDATVRRDFWTLIFGNDASTSDDNVFGTILLL